MEDISKIDGHLINADGTISSTTIDDVDRIIHERNKAIIAGDKEKVDQCQQQLKDAGAIPSTTEEILAFAKSTDAYSQVLERATSSISYDTYTYYAYANGTRYQIKRITANPTTNSNLFHSASINNKTISSTVSAGTYELCRVMGTIATGSAYVGSVANSCISAYDALRSVITGFTPSTTVYGITASYSCAALEQVSFYQYLTPSGYWTPFATSSYIQTGFSSTIFSTNYSGGSKSGLNMSISSLEDTIYSPYSLNSSGTGYNTGNMLERYFTTYLFDKKSQVTSAVFHHDANGTQKHIKTLAMLCPTTTSDIT